DPHRQVVEVGEGELARARTAAPDACCAADESLGPDQHQDENSTLLALPTSMPWMSPLASLKTVITSPADMSPLVTLPLPTECEPPATRVTLNPAVVGMVTLPLVIRILPESASVRFMLAAVVPARLPDTTWPLKSTGPSTTSVSEVSPSKRYSP